MTLTNDVEGRDVSGFRSNLKRSPYFHLRPSLLSLYTMLQLVNVFVFIECVSGATARKDPLYWLTPHESMPSIATVASGWRKEG